MATRKAPVEATETTQTPAQDAVKAGPARETVDGLYQAEQDLTARRMAKDDELASAHQEAGDEALAAAMGGSASKRSLTRLATIRDEMLSLEAAIDAARRQRLSAVPGIWRAQASALREQIASLQAEVDQRQAQTDELLSALEAHEGVVYTADEPADLHDLVKMHGSWTITVPKTQVLRDQIHQLEAQAAALEAKQVVTGGMIRATSRADLYHQLFEYDPMQLAPPMFACLTWYDEATERERERRRKGGVWDVHLDRDIAAELVWKDGQIDRERSRVDAFKSPGSDLDTFN